MAKVHLPQSVEDWELNYASAAAARLRGPADLSPGIRAPQARGGLRPSGWRAAIRRRFGREQTQDTITSADGWRLELPEWAQAWSLLELVRHFEREHGDAIGWDISDDDICAMAKKLAGYADELDDGSIAQGLDLPARVDAVRLLVRSVGIQETRPSPRAGHQARAGPDLVAQAAARARGARGRGRRDWPGRVHRDSGGYISRGGLERRQQQLQRNAEGLTRRLYRKRSARSHPARPGALGTSNPTIRGGELMTRIRGAENTPTAAGTSACSSR